MNQLATLYEINKEANSILLKQLGLSKTLRFLNQFTSGKGNYTYQKEDIFSGKTVQDIVDEMKKQ